VVFRDGEQFDQGGGLFQQFAGGEAVADSSAEFLKHGPNLLRSIHTLSLSIPVRLYFSLAGGVPINELIKFILKNNKTNNKRIDEM